MGPRETSKLSVSVALAAFAACAGSMLCVLSAFATEPGHTIDASRALDAGAPLTAVDVVIGRTPPDPPPLVAREQWVFDLRWERGAVWLLGVKPLELAAAQATPRAMGRFALELFEGAALIERVRFDFPLLGAPDPVNAGWTAPPSFTQGLRTRIGVVFPAVNRGTRLDLVDRATSHRYTLPWPPPAPTRDAGSAGRDL